jgi:hypothetical protein
MKVGAVQIFESHKTPEVAGSVGPGGMLKQVKYGRRSAGRHD